MKATTELLRKFVMNGTLDPSIPIGYLQVDLDGCDPYSGAKAPTCKCCLLFNDHLQLPFSKIFTKGIQSSQSWVEARLARRFLLAQVMS
jgi:hypothetical protein